MKLSDFLKRLEPFFAIGILIMLIIVGSNLISYNKMQEQIAETTHWVDEDVRCFCEKSEVIAMEQAALKNFSLDNISWSGN